MEAIFNSATGGNIRPNYLKKLKVSSNDDPHDVEEEFFVDYGDTPNCIDGCGWIQYSLIISHFH